MFVIRLPNGNLQVPQTAIHTGDGRIIGDVYVEIGPQDADYDRLAAQAITPAEAEQRKDQFVNRDAARESAAVTPRSSRSIRQTPARSAAQGGSYSQGLAAAFPHES